MSMTKPIVLIEKVYADGSGAPGTVLCEGYYFAAEFVCEARLTSLTNRAAPRRIIEAARRAYTKELSLHGDVSDSWYVLNRTMYASK